MLYRHADIEVLAVNHLGFRNAILPIMAVVLTRSSSRDAIRLGGARLGKTKAY